jgi:hypothetical protein
VTWLTPAVGRFSPEVAILEHHLSAIDVIAKTPPAQAEPVLTFTLRDTFEFLDVVPSAAVIGVVSENIEGFGVAIGKLGAAFL